MSEEIPLFEIPWDERDVDNVVDSVTRGGYWAKGPYVSEFERRIESYLGVEHALAVNSGTTALVCALKGHGVGEGDEVIVPSFTFIATANAVALAGARPVFADIERETFGLDPASVRDVVTEDTAAIVPVHPYGSACLIDELAEVAAAADVPLVEDAAEALGADYRGRALGTVGDSAALSFCQNKIVPVGEGGAIVTDDDELAERVRLWRSHGRASEEYFDDSSTGEYVALGTNVRMADVVAALGCGQMEKVESLIEGRRRAARLLGERIESISHVSPHVETELGRHVYQLYTVRLDEGVDRDALIAALGDRGIASKVYWDPPAHLTEHYQTAYGYTEGTLPVTEAVAGRVLSLPMHPNLSRDEIDRIGDALSRAVAAAT